MNKSQTAIIYAHDCIHSCQNKMTLQKYFVKLHLHGNSNSSSKLMLAHFVPNGWAQVPILNKSLWTTIQKSGFIHYAPGPVANSIPKIFLMNSPLKVFYAFMTQVTDYGHMMSKPLFLCSPNSYPNPKYTTRSIEIITKIFRKTPLSQQKLSKHNLKCFFHESFIFLVKVENYKCVLNFTKSFVPTKT